MNDFAWLISDDALRRVESALDHNHELTDTQAAIFDKRTASAPAGLEVSDGVARISISGVLTPEPDFILQFFGGGNTSYREIQEALALAGDDERVKSIELRIDSPGGTVAGMFETVEAIRAASKPVTARASLAASAAYGLASAADSIEATGESSAFGSVGVVASYRVSDRIVDITSTNAPDKRPNPGTEEGRAVIRAHLDEIHALFAGAIAEGRGVSSEEVDASFGRGRVFLAGEAQRRGMIDSISAQSSGQVSQSATAEEKGKTMDLETLKAEHPEVYSAALKVGEAQERERVAAHLSLGQECDAMATALEAIESGAGLTTKLHAEYLKASVRKHDRAELAADEAQASEATAGAGKPVSKEAEASDYDKAFAAEFSAKLGRSCA